VLPIPLCVERWLERVHRLDAEIGRIVATPFPKFFNYGERGREFPALLRRSKSWLAETVYPENLIVVRYASARTWCY
jgi:hypothetical protein